MFACTKPSAAAGHPVPKPPRPDTSVRPVHSSGFSAHAMNTPSPSAAAPAATPSADDLQTLLANDQPSHWWQRPALWIGAAAVVVLAAGLTYWQTQKQASATPSYVTEAVRK